MEKERNIYLIANRFFQIESIKKDIATGALSPYKLEQAKEYMEESENAILKITSSFLGCGFDDFVFLPEESSEYKLMFSGIFALVDTTEFAEVPLTHIHFKVKVVPHFTGVFDLTIIRGKGWTDPIEKAYGLENYIGHSLSYFF